MKPTKKQILAMVQDIVFEVDYDHGKAIFIEECMEEPEGAYETQDDLVAVAQKHIDKWK